MEPSLGTKTVSVELGGTRWNSVSLGELQGVRCDGFLGVFVSIFAVLG